MFASPDGRSAGPLLRGRPGHQGQGHLQTTWRETSHLSEVQEGKTDRRQRGGLQWLCGEPRDGALLRGQDRTSDDSPEGSHPRVHSQEHRVNTLNKKWWSDRDLMS